MLTLPSFLSPTLTYAHTRNTYVNTYRVSSKLGFKLHKQKERFQLRRSGETTVSYGIYIYIYILYILFFDVVFSLTNFSTLFGKPGTAAQRCATALKRTGF